MADDVLVKKAFLGVSSHLGGVYQCLRCVDRCFCLIYSGLKLYLVKCEKYLAFVNALTFVHMYFGDESRHLRTDVDVSFTLDGGRVGIFHLRIFGRQGDGGNLGSRHLLLLLTAAARTHGDEGCACYNCGGSIHYGNFHTSFFFILP